MHALYTHRDYVVTGDTIGTLDEVMHLSVFLIPCFKSLFTPCSLSPNTGTKTQRCSLLHNLHAPTVYRSKPHRSTASFRSYKSNKYSLMALLSYVTFTDWIRGTISQLNKLCRRVPDQNTERNIIYIYEMGQIWSEHRKLKWLLICAPFSKFCFLFSKVTCGCLTYI